MMKALEKLVASKTNARVGNHAVRHTKDLTRYNTGHGCKVTSWGTFINHEEGADAVCTRVFTYHDNPICLVDDDAARVILTHAGWFTPSTSRALNDYRRYFVNELGYVIVWNL